ncbi:MAG: hypothetical protein NZ765_08745 [Anaerolineae bacterium]|nr:hypothetical protein [Anaerolineae bacterium]MDW8070814.1 hypothetical protein [Anaerolineae bacterium]
MSSTNEGKNLSSHHISGERAVAEDAYALQTQPLSVTIVAPSKEIGDFAANRGNVWDMADRGDIAMVHNAESVALIRIGEDTILRGNMRDGPPHLGFVVFWGSSRELFPAKQYHHMIFRLKIQARRDCWTNGRVGYTKVWSGYEDVVIRASVSTYPYVPHIPPMSCSHGNFCIYYIDLARNNNWPGWPTWHTARSPNDPSTWLTDPIRGVGIVPHEWCANVRANPDYFDLDFVYLTGDIVARAEDGYRYRVRYDLNAPGAQRVVVTIRYREVHELRPPGQEPLCDADSFGYFWQDFDPPAREEIQLVTPEPPEPTGENRVFLPVIAKAISAGRGQWSYWLDFSDNSRFQDGKSYYLCFEANADDGARRTYQVSSAPVIRVPRTPWFGPD